MTRPDADAAAPGVWPMLLVRGILAILFGLAVLFAPATALLAIVFVFGAYAILDGIIAAIAGLRHRRQERHWVWQILQGLISIAAGLVAFGRPLITVVAVLVLVAIWAIVFGVAAILEAVAMRRRGAGTWTWELTAGVLGVLVGLVLLFWPSAAAVGLLWLVGIYGLLSGAVTIGWALRLRRVSATTSSART
jgi:uncharacterized membrane protein HdeD (DUF308 family)